MNTGEVKKEEFNACRNCGACCAHFRILLNWTEIEEFHRDGVPADMTLKISEFIHVMKGTEKSPVRCAALDGEVGGKVFCRIYDKRCSQCRDFNILMDDGQRNQACTEVREVFGLPPA